MTDRPSIPEQLRAFPKAWKLVLTVLGALGALWAAGWGAGQFTARVYAEAATKSYVRAEIDAAVLAECDRRKAPDSLACRIADDRQRYATERMAAEQDARDRRTVERAMMKRLVRYDASDLEADRRRKMDSANNSSRAFADKCAQYVTSGSCAGMSLEDAAQYALDARNQR